VRGELWPILQTTLAAGAAWAIAASIHSRPFFAPVSAVIWLGVAMLVVARSMGAALLLGAGTILVNQAAVSAILVVATLQPGSSRRRRGSSTR
jgi:hypothetical protein